MALYAGTLAVGAGAFLALRWLGRALPVTRLAEAPPVGGGHGEHLLASVLLALAAIIVAARALGWVMQRWLLQPPVIGEIAAGILLGPSVLGALAPAASEALLPATTAPYLGLLSKVGVVLFMFVVGLELDLSGRREGGLPALRTLGIANASVLAPFVAGSALALWLYPRYGSGVGLTPFSLFIGVALSVTAFPVLARILKDRGVHQTPLGVLALTCAAVDDVTAWVLLAFVVGITTTAVTGVLVTLVLVAAYLAAMFLVVRPLGARFAAWFERPERPIGASTLAPVFVALLLSAAATEHLGVHALFGAFLFGAVLPHQGRLAEALRHRIEDLVVVLLLPAFFAFTGMRTQVNLLHGASDWLACLAIVLVASAGKIGGATLAARVSGLSWRDSSALGALMNTRGLMELIVLDVGLELGVLGPRLFAMLVVMALSTTFFTTPLLAWLRALGSFGGGGLPAPGTAQGVKV